MLIADEAIDKIILLPYVHRVSVKLKHSQSTVAEAKNCEHIDKPKP